MHAALNAEDPGMSFRRYCAFNADRTEAASEDTQSLETHVNDVDIRKWKTHQIELFMEC